MSCDFCQISIQCHFCILNRNSSLFSSRYRSNYNCICPDGTPRLQRISNDLEKIQTITSSLDCSVNSHSIRDYLRFGKYSVNRPKPRPLLVHLNRVSDVQAILSKRSSVPPPHIIRPDLPPSLRIQERVLLRERKSLIESGNSRQSIKIKDSSKINVDNSLWGSVSGSEFTRSSGNDDTSLGSGDENSPDHGGSLSVMIPILEIILIHSLLSLCPPNHLVLQLVILIID